VRNNYDYNKYSSTVFQYSNISLVNYYQTPIVNIIISSCSSSSIVVVIVPARKQNLTRNSHSSVLKIAHFGIPEKPTMDCVSLYAGLISKVSEEITSENAENCRCRQPLDAPSRRSAYEYPHKPYSARQ